jgi:hypothetical protein
MFHGLQKVGHPVLIKSSGVVIKIDGLFSWIEQRSDAPDPSICAEERSELVHQIDPLRIGFRMHGGDLTEEADELTDVLLGKGGLEWSLHFRNGGCEQGCTRHGLRRDAK